MDRRRRRKHSSHKRSLVIVDEHRPYLASTPGGTITVDKLEHAVADEAAGLTDQENARFEREAASDRVDRGRRRLQEGVKQFATVSAVVAPAGGLTTPFDGTRPPSDDQLIARVEAIHAAASADPDTFVKGGITPGGIDALAADLAAFKTAKDTMTLAGKQHNEATERFDKAADQASEAIAVLEGVLTVERDSPVGARNALRQAKRIGPRVEDKPAESTPVPDTPAQPPASPVPNTAAE